MPGTPKTLKSLTAILIAAICASPGLANVSVEFLEGAPKDRFVVSNNGVCDLEAVTVVVDLASSASGVIFDVSERGAGVEVFQPFELVEGGALVRAAAAINDGDQAVTLELSGLPQGERVAFTVDVDDTQGGREITVSGSELQGATATIQSSNWTVTQAFAANAVADLQTPACS